MKLLGLKAYHYKNCVDGITLTFLPLFRKSEEDKTYELNKIDEELYIFSTTSIVGKNASGKTSILNLLKDVYSILGSFQLKDEVISIDGTKLEITFYENKKVYIYETELNRQLNLGNNLSFTKESLKVMNYSKTKKNAIFNDKNYKKLNINKALPDDISILFYILKNRNNYAYYFDDLISKENVYHDVYALYQNGHLNKAYWKYILQLFDEHIQDLQEVRNDVYALTTNNETQELSAKELFHMLSSGTTKGIILYTSAIQALKEGKTFIIDEIENHFHKTLVENLIVLFKDKSVNKKGANLVFSTHYCELLDMFNRNDNIWISKYENQIILSNMYRDYNVRNDLLKSKKFYEDNFGTAVSYELLMNLKRTLMNE
ncbi:MAG: ATP-binding protein [Erysipelotrichaceae bacterium]|nr:ATP-binding protein [Erysipelotrichaceae bacterium]